jgi:hypothetical protein
VEPLLSEPWILDVDTTLKPLYGRQEGAVVGYNPRKPGRPSHCYHTYSMAGARLVFDVDVCAGDEHASNHAAPALWALLDRISRDCWPALLRGDNGFGNEAIASRPLLLHAIAERVRHARQTTIKIASTHARSVPAAEALRAVATFLRGLVGSAEQSTSNAGARSSPERSRPSSRAAPCAFRSAQTRVTQPEIEWTRVRKMKETSNCGS